MQAPAEWDVGIVWLTRRLRRPDRMLRDRWRAAQPQPEPSRATSDRGNGLNPLDALDGCTSFGDAALIVVVVVVVAAFVILGPPLLAITLGLIEIVLLVAAAVAGLAGRLLFRQPWEVVARRADREATWRISGWRPARRLLGEIEASLRLGFDPDHIAPAHRDTEPPAGLGSVPGLYHRDEFRLLGRVYGAAFGVAVAVGILFLVVTLS